MDEIKFQQPTGFKVQNKTFEFLQNAYQSAIGHLCKMYGDNLILYGCELVGSSRTAGAVVINGELLPFEASPDNDKILIEETTQTVQYKSGELLPAYYTRKAKCSSTGTIDFSDLQRITTGRKKPEPTQWQDVIWQPGFINPGNGIMKSRIDESGKGLVWGSFNEFEPRTDGMHAVAQLSFKPSVRQTINIYPFENNLSTKIPNFGWIDTDGKLYINIDEGGHYVNQQGWVVCVVEL